MASAAMYILRTFFERQNGLISLWAFEKEMRIEVPGLVTHADITYVMSFAGRHLSRGDVERLGGA